MTLRQQLGEASQRNAKVVGRVVVVMQMHFDFTEAGAAETGKGVEILGLVLFDRIKERVTRRPAVAVVEAAELTRIIMDPALNAASADFGGRAILLRFVMVGDAQ